MAGPVKWHFLEWGKSKRPTLVLLHGLLGTSRDWEPFARILGETHHCLAFDLPGHGKSRLLSQKFSFSIQNVAGELTQLLMRLGIDSCSLLGYSMGGRIALALALEYPNLVEKLILESASPGIRSAEESKLRLARDSQWGRMLKSLALADFLNAWYGQPLFDSLRSHPEFSEMIKHRLDARAEELAKCIVGASQGGQPDQWEQLNRLTCPTLLIAGEKDKKYVSLLTEAKTKIPDAALQIIQQAGHNVHFENPQQFIASVRSHLGPS